MRVRMPHYSVRISVADIPQVQCKVFNTTFNPERLRLGSRILHQRLKGPAVASYYPPRIGTIKQLRALYPQNQIIDEEEEDWLEHLNVARSRGKGTPKKKRTAAGRSYQPFYLCGSRLIWSRIEKVQQAKVTLFYDCISIVQSIITRRYLVYIPSLRDRTSGWQTIKSTFPHHLRFCFS